MSLANHICLITRKANNGAARQRKTNNFRLAAFALDVFILVKSINCEISASCQAVRANMHQS